MSGPKHTPDTRALYLANRAETHANFGGYQFTPDELREIATLLRSHQRLAAELAAWRAWAERWGRDIETSVSVSPITHNELVERLAATNAALREAGVS